MSAKSEVIELVQRLPDDAPLPDIVAELYVHLRLEQALADERAGRFVSHDEVRRRLTRWLESSGQ